MIRGLHKGGAGNCDGHEAVRLASDLRLNWGKSERQALGQSNSKASKSTFRIVAVACYSNESLSHIAPDTLPLD